MVNSVKIGQVFLRMFSFSLSLSFLQWSSHLIRISFIFNELFYKFFVLLAVYVYCTWGIDKYSGKIIHIKVKQSHCSPGQTLGFPGG